MSQQHTPRFNGALVCAVSNQWEDHREDIRKMALQLEATQALTAQTHAIAGQTHALMGQLVTHTEHLKKLDPITTLLKFVAVAMVGTVIATAVLRGQNVELTATGLHIGDRPVPVKIVEPNIPAPPAKE